MANCTVCGGLIVNDECENYIEKVEAFHYLDELRESGITNMFGAAPYLMEALELAKKDASKYLQEWMQEFGGEITHK